jgi:prepilin-type N-terminal cleavage/methylation domain-containing protein
MMTRANRQRGFTLVELLVAMTLVTIVLGLAFQISVIVINGYKDHREGVSVQRAARGSLDLIADAVRNASAAVPSGAISDASGCAAFNGVSVVDGGDAPDEVYVMTAAGGVVSSLRTRIDQGDSSATVVDATGLVAGDLVLVTDFDTGHILRLSSDPSASGSYYNLDFDTPSCGASYVYPEGSLLVRAKVARFYIEDLDGVPTLYMDPDDTGPEAAEPLAEGVEDFQVAVGVDFNGDGSVTDTQDTLDEWYGNAQGDEPAPAVTTLPWRALRMTLVARTLVEDARGDWSERPALENRDGGEMDGFRRRMVSTIVEIRNLEGSP